MFVCQIRYTNREVEKILSQVVIIYSKSACLTGTTSSISTTTTPRSHSLSPSHPKRAIIKMISSILTIRLSATTNCLSCHPKISQSQLKVLIIMMITRRSMKRWRRLRVLPRSNQRKPSMSNFTMMRTCLSQQSADYHLSTNSHQSRKTYL